MVVLSLVLSPVLSPVLSLARTAAGSAAFQKKEGALLRRKRAYGDLGRTSGKSRTAVTRFTGSSNRRFRMCLALPDEYRLNCDLTIVAAVSRSAGLLV